jgi:hypothetical protein
MARPVSYPGELAIPRLAKEMLTQALADKSGAVRLFEKGKPSQKRMEAASRKAVEWQSDSSDGVFSFRWCLENNDDNPLWWKWKFSVVKPNGQNFRYQLVKAAVARGIPEDEARSVWLKRPAGKRSWTRYEEDEK